MARTLVTGANGFVGRALVDELLRRGETVRAAVRNGQQVDGWPDQVVIGDLCDQTEWAKTLQQVTTVVHLAARAHVVRETAADSLSRFRQVNVEGALALARAAADAGVRRFVFLSTVKVHGEGSPMPYREDDPAAPEDLYAQSKWEAEQGLREIAAQTGMELVVLRAPLVYGPAVVANFLQLMDAVQRGWVLPLAGIENRRSMLYLGNLVDAIITCIHHPLAAQRVFLLADGEAISTPGLVFSLGRALGRPVHMLSIPPGALTFVARLLGRSQMMARLTGSLTVNDQAIRTTLGWQPPYSMEQGLSATANWYRLYRRVR